MNINILRYSLFSIAGGQEVDRIFVKVLNSKLVNGTKLEDCE